MMPLMVQKNFYSVLGISVDSDDVVVRAAYKALMLKFHPDTNNNANATKRAAEINEAFQILGNASRRSAYDETLRSFDSSHGDSSPTPPPPPPPPKTAPGDVGDDPELYPSVGKILG